MWLLSLNFENGCNNYWVFLTFQDVRGGRLGSILGHLNRFISPRGDGSDTDQTDLEDAELRAIITTPKRPSASVPSASQDGVTVTTTTESRSPSLPVRGLPLKVLTETIKEEEEEEEDSDERPRRASDETSGPQAQVTVESPKVQTTPDVTTRVVIPEGKLLSVDVKPDGHPHEE